MATGNTDASNSTEQTLLADIRLLPSITPEQTRLLRRLGIRRGVDLLFHFPRSCEEPASLETVDTFQENQRTSFVGVIQEIDERVTQTGKHLLGAQIAPEGGGAVRLLWFNQPFRKRELRPGLRVRATGVVKSTVLNWEMLQPQICFLEAGEQPEQDRPLPNYPLTEGLKQTHLRKIMNEALPRLIPQVEDVLPASLRERLGIVEIQRALTDIHFPADLAAFQAARRRFVTQELLVLQLAIAMQRAGREREALAPRCEPSGKIHSRILNRLGFILTGDQRAAIEDIGRDMASDKPMNRLLQGDVGSGKTVVAQYAMLLCVAHGYQATLMAPTEVLARQHAHTMKKSLASSRVRIALLTGSLSRSERGLLLNEIAAGEVDLVVGTQALLSSDIRFKNLGLAIVDEQHKFGVMQRAQLRTDAPASLRSDASGEGVALQPHYLVLSATPIPRTIAMTAFGDLDVSTIREKPPGRAPVHSYVAAANELGSWWKFVDEQIKGGRQAYVIAPRVEESNSDEVVSVVGLYDQLRNSNFSHRKVGLLHGRLDSSEKERILAEFAAGEIDLLVATTVVEVGIDVPNATVMTILDANRLGLSQLHQLRGRISRGTHPGFVCVVATSASDGEVNERLNAFKKSNDGFELAEMDLRMRGPGDLLGTSQSGLPPLKIASLVDDAEAVIVARTVAKELLLTDPELADPQLTKLRLQTVKRYGKSMQLSDVG